MSDTISQMRREVLEIPTAVDRLLTSGASDIQHAAAAVRTLDPNYLVTVARGSSDHICTYLKYATEILLGRPVASIGPSVASIFKAPLHLDNSLCISVSQSGQSPDIVEMARAAKRDGSLSVAITNDPASPLANTSDHTLQIHAGPERSVAATKTFVTSAVAGLSLLAEWRGDADLRGAIHTLPEALERAISIDWPEVRAAIGEESSLFTLGRGPVWAVSNEAALKFKETCQIHAESYSSAEVLHGPVSIVDEGFPVLCFAAADAAQDALVEIADQVAAKGAKVFVTSKRSKAAVGIDHIRTDHALTDPLSLIVSFYAMVERVAASRGINPDAPRHLKKVTETV
ncbi:MAG: SIS domain-containing protein [Rhodobacteraceae bacterium]|nr:SIS domain-containing protein [Paracoccaceae bacterium]